MTARNKNDKLKAIEMQNALCEMGRLRDDLGEAYLHFDNTNDPDVLDACVYEINALRSRWNAAYKHYRTKFGP